MGIGDAGPNEIIEAAKIRHLAELDSKRHDALTLIGMIRLASEGGDPLDSMGHLYQKDELARIKRTRQENEERRKEEQLFRVLRMYAISKKLGINDTRTDDRRA